jgi:hypothetical protein
MTAMDGVHGALPCHYKSPPQAPLLPHTSLGSLPIDPRPKHTSPRSLLPPARLEAHRGHLHAVSKVQGTPCPNFFSPSFPYACRS